MDWTSTQASANQWSQEIWLASPDWDCKMPLTEPVPRYHTLTADTTEYICRHAIISFGSLLATIWSWRWLGSVMGLDLSVHEESVHSCIGQDISCLRMGGILLASKSEPTLLYPGLGRNFPWEHRLLHQCSIQDPCTFLSDLCLRLDTRLDPDISV